MTDEENVDRVLAQVSDEENGRNNADLVVAFYARLLEAAPLLSRDQAVALTVAWINIWGRSREIKMTLKDGE